MTVKGLEKWGDSITSEQIAKKIVASYSNGKSFIRYEEKEVNR